MTPGNAMQQAAVRNNTSPRKSTDLTTSVGSFPQAPDTSSGNGPDSTPNDLSYRRYEKGGGNRASPIVHRTLDARLPKTCDNPKMWRRRPRIAGSLLGNRANLRT